MSPRPWLTLVLLAVLTAGCGSPAPTYRTLGDFSSLDLEDHSLITTGSIPPPPKGFSNADVRVLAEMLTEVAERGAYDREVWHPESQQAAIDHVLRDLDPDVRDLLLDAVREQLDGRPWASFVGTVFADGVKVIGKPRMQRATWDVDRDDVDGEAWLTVRLQTRTFYAVRHKGRRNVIVATHTWGLSTPGPVGSFVPVPELGAEAIGAEPCAFILRSVITPEPNEKRYLKDMKEQLRDASPTRFVEPSGDNGEATAKACRADS
jgi:hypothetical protein